LARVFATWLNTPVRETPSGAKVMDHVRSTDAQAAQAAVAGSMENEALLPFIISIGPDSMVLSYKLCVILK
jgi:hypothetical protein